MFLIWEKNVMSFVVGEINNLLFEAIQIYDLTFLENL